MLRRRGRQRLSPEAGQMKALGEGVGWTRRAARVWKILAVLLIAFWIDRPENLQGDGMGLFYALNYGSIALMRHIVGFVKP
jgi:hypothetical protein